MAEYIASPTKRRIDRTVERIIGTPNSYAASIRELRTDNISNTKKAAAAFISSAAIAAGKTSLTTEQIATYFNQYAQFDNRRGDAKLAQKRGSKVGVRLSQIEAVLSARRQQLEGVVAAAQNPSVRRALALARGRNGTLKNEGLDKGRSGVLGAGL